jgi:hypothetical protein
MPTNDFKNRIINEFLPLFCNHPSRGYDINGFTNNFSEIGDSDAKNFLRAIDAGLVGLDEKGKLYKAPRTKEGEQLFWEFDRDAPVRRTSISVEVVITIATISVLHFDYGWPKSDLGTQSLQPFRGAIDVMAHIDTTYPNGYIACEIKKDKPKTDQLIKDVIGLGSRPAVELQRKHNLYTTNRKVDALRYWRPPIFWALGPEGYGSVFKMAYAEDGTMAFERGSLADLQYPVPAALLAGSN